MGKLFNTMILGIIITLVLLIFNGNGETPTSLFLMLLNPSGWEVNGFYLILAGLATVSGGIILIGAAILKQDWVARAGIMIGLNTITIAPFIDFFNFIHSQTNFIGTGYSCVTSPLCSYIQSGGIGQVIALVVAGPLILYALWAIVEYVWRGDS